MKMNKKKLVFDIETTGLNPLGSRITCICAKVIGGNEYRGSHINEKKLINDFIKWMKKEKITLLISANGIDFDMPFIFMRAFFNKINFEILNFIGKLNHFDVIKIADKKISLNNLARIYGFKLKSGEGINAIKLFQKLKLEELMDYCMDDVILTEKIYLKYSEIENKTGKDIIKEIIKNLIFEEREILLELKKELKKGKEHYKRSYPISLSEGRIQAYNKILNIFNKNEKS